MKSLDNMVKDSLYEFSVPDSQVENVEKDELNQVVLREIDNLHERWSEFIKLKYFKGMEEAEFSEIMDVPKSIFTSSVSRSKKILELRLARYVA